MTQAADLQRGAPSRMVAPAKLTLSLRITGVRPDGYHLIDAEMVTLDIGDELTITETVGGSVGESVGESGLTVSVLTVRGPFADGVPTDGSNLVLTALSLVGRTAHVDLDKRIPHGGGLGGGSADAAAVLRWAGYRDVAGASRLGADVSFCLVGGRARVTGIGEIVEPLPFVATDITLFIPRGLSVSTPAAYQAWDELGGSGINHLEDAALAVEPRLRAVRAAIHEAIGEPPTLAGSGATWFALGHHQPTAPLPGVDVVHTRTTPTSA